MPLKCMFGLLALQSCVVLTGCYPGAPQSWIPGTYHFSRSGYVTTLELRQDRTSIQTRQNPDHSTTTVKSKWRVGPLDGHITIDQVVAFFPEPGVDMDKPGFYTPEVDILFGRVCLLVSGRKDLEMCKR